MSVSGSSWNFQPDKSPQNRTVRFKTGHLATLKVAHLPRNKVVDFYGNTGHFTIRMRVAVRRQHCHTPRGRMCVSWCVFNNLATSLVEVHAVLSAILVSSEKKAEMYSSSRLSCLEAFFIFLDLDSALTVIFLCHTLVSMESRRCLQSVSSSDLLHEGQHWVTWPCLRCRRTTGFKQRSRPLTGFDLALASVSKLLCLWNRHRDPQHCQWPRYVGECSIS